MPNDSAQISDSVFAEVKGPDPKEWGERPVGATAMGLEIGEVRHEGTEDEVKGPGPQWQKNDQGEFVNR